LIAEQITPSSLFQRFLPSALLVLALGITAAWATFLGYEFVEVFVAPLLGIMGQLLQKQTGIL
jgi:hypothetical protein